MDPRSAATPEVLAQQLELGRQIFGETIEARRALAEIGSVSRNSWRPFNKSWGNRPQGARSAQLKSALAAAQSGIGNILANKILVNEIHVNQEHAPEEGPGLEEAYASLASALRVVESGGHFRIPVAGGRGLQRVKPAGKSAHRGVDWIQANKIDETQPAIAGG